MHRSRSFSMVAGALSLALLTCIGVIATTASADVGSAQTVRAASAALPAPVAPVKADQAEYVGQDTCLTCHEDMTKGLNSTPHGRVTDARTPAAKQGCESCHGPGGKHIEDPSAAGGLRKFDQISAAEASAACATCHNKSQHAMWEGSAHDARNVSCVTCHSVHEPKSAKAQLKTVTQTETCATCHKTQSMKVKRSAHMPVREGKMECSSCHNPHGSTNVKNLRVGNYVNESCVSCHNEKRGPFLFEHAAGRESCVSCHDPHGSSNDRMLVAKAPMLCQRCHIHTRHPGTIYDQVAVNNKSNRIVGRACINCHQQIHGTNHPSGATFVR